jgi:hypothetical protein
MTGTGTLLDPYIIWDLADLQAVREYDAAYFQLGADIDATPTAGWYGGAGFEPLDWPYPQKRYPTGDFAQVGNWTVFPVAPATFWDKVDELDQDDDATYIRIDALGGNILFTTPNFNIPAGSTGISLGMEPISRTEVAGNVFAKMYIRVNGTNYAQTNWRSFAFQITYTYANLFLGCFSTNPDTGLPWTVDDINGVGPNPLQAVGVLVQAGRACRITKLVAVVTCEPLVNITFDGKGHSITGLTINRGASPAWYDQANVGLFRYLDGGVITNINLVNCNIKGRNVAAAIVSGSYWSSGGISNCNVSGAIESFYGEIGGIAGYLGEPGGNVSNCHFTGTLTITSAASGTAGGIVGYPWAVVGGPYTIQNCSANVTINGGVTAYHGGIVGQSYQYNIISCTAEGTITGGSRQGGIAGELNDGNMTDCFADVDITGWLYNGGVAGYADAGIPLSFSIVRSRAIGNISCAGQDYIGGLVGYADGYRISQSFATGNVTGDDRVGGLVGYSSSAISNSYAIGDVVGDDSVGGLVGNNDDTIQNSFSAGQVTGVTNVGGLVGLNGGTITNSFWDTETSGQTTSDGGTGKTTAEMKSLDTFLSGGWDIEARSVDKNNGYPYLAWQSVWYIFVWVPPPPAISVLTLPATEIR